MAPAPEPNPLGLRENPWPARVTVVERVYYESEADPSREIADHSYSVYLKTDEQPWAGRRQTVGPAPVKLDLGYLSDRPISELVVENTEGLGGRVIPTPEQAAKTAGLVVFLSRSAAEGPFASVRPGRSVRFEPVSEVWASCPVGSARIKVSATPGD
jgi:hypothetical protein